MMSPWWYHHCAKEDQVLRHFTVLYVSLRCRCPEYLLHLYLLATRITQSVSWNVFTRPSGSVIQQKSCTVVIINQDCWQGKGSRLSRSGDSHAWAHISLNDENSTHWFSEGANNACNWFKCDPRHGGLCRRVWLLWEIGPDSGFQVPLGSRMDET